MSYQVLARKWRPRVFAELAGQEHVIRALSNALDQQRLHHAFLFTGARGVGKTTIARIFAKALNCETGVSSTPCGVCPACQAIDAGRFVDLMEVDAASRTKVEDTRELLENVQYAPSRGRFKVYLIDEVHMLSGHSFNALLKTLEEPPPHVKFLLATTDPQKLPVTVLSRCLQFNLKRLPTEQIVAHLEPILTAEHITYDLAAVRHIARAGDGSLRDALSLLDQAIAFGNGQVDEASVQTMLGDVDRRRVVELLEALAAHDAPAVLHQVAALDAFTPDYTALLADLLTVLQRLALIQAVPDAAPDDEVMALATAQRLATTLTPEDVQLFYQIALLGRRDLPLCPDPRGGFEMVLLRMLCFRPTASETASPPHPQATTVPAPSRPLPSVPDAPAPAPTTAPVAAPASPSPPAPASITPQSAALDQNWSQLADSLGLTAIARQVVVNCALIEQSDDQIRLALASGHAQLLTKSVEERIRLALEQRLGRSIRLSFQIGAVSTATPAHQRQAQQARYQQETTERVLQDPQVRELQERFGAHIEAIHPLSPDGFSDPNRGNPDSTTTQPIEEHNP